MRINSLLTPVAIKWVSRGHGARSRDTGADRTERGPAARGIPMAMILEFRSSQVREEPREVAEPRSAQIIIFPGVRRERHVEQQKPRRRDRARAKRDLLELPD